MAAPTVRATAQVATSINVPPSFTSPASTQIGDLLIFSHTSGVGTSGTVNFGFTQIRNDVVAGAWAQSTCYRIATVAGAQTYTPWSDNMAGIGIITVITAGTFNATTPINAHDGTASSIESTGWDVPSITTTYESLMVGIAGFKITNSGTYDITPPSELTEVLDSSTAATNDLAVATRAEASAGTFNYGLWDSVTVGNGYSNQIIAIAGVPTPTAPTQHAPVSGDIYDRISQGVTFDWTHNSPASAAQTEYQLSMSQGANPAWYWNGSAWTQTASWVVSATTGVTIPTGTNMPVGYHNWQVKTKDANGESPISGATDFTVTSFRDIGTTTMAADASLSNVLHRDRAFASQFAADGSLSSALQTERPLGTASMVADATLIGGITEDQAFAAVIAADAAFNPILSGVGSLFDAIMVADGSLSSVLHRDRSLMVTSKAAVAPTFARTSIAYDALGAQVASGVARYADAVSPNLLTPNAASAEVDASGWNQFGFANTTRSRSTEQARYGSASIKLVATSAGSVGALTADAAALIGGLSYAASLDVYCPTSRTATLRLKQYNAGGGNIATLATAGTVIPAGTWTRLSLAGTVHATAVTSKIEIEFAGLGAGEAVYIDGAQVEQAAAATPFQLPGRPFGQGILIEEGTTNLLTANQSNVETNATPFVAITGASISRSTLEKWEGATSLRVVCPGVAAGEGFEMAPGATGLASSQSYIGSVWVKGPAGATVQPFAQERTTADGFVAQQIGAVVTLTGNLQRISTPVMAFGATGTRFRIGVMTNVTQAITFYADGFQVEQKAYATSWQIGGTARVAEQLTVAGLTSKMPPANGTVETRLRFRDDARMAQTGRFLTLGGYAQSGSIAIRNRRDPISPPQDNLGFLTQGSTPAALWTDTSSIMYHNSGGTSWFDNNFHALAITIQNGTTIKAYWDGVLRTTVTLSNPITSWAVDELLLLVDPNHAANVEWADLRLSNTVHSDAKILADYNSGEPLRVEQDTTYKLNFDGTTAATDYDTASALAADSTLAGTVTQERSLASSFVTDSYLAGQAEVEVPLAVTFTSDGVFTPTMLKDVLFAAQMVADNFFAGDFSVFQEVGLVVITPTPPYRVVIAEINGDELEEVPAKNLQYNFALDEPGACNFVLPIKHAKSLRSLLDPGKREVHVYRRGVRVWGGYLWFASASSSDPTVRFAAEGYLSRLRRRLVTDLLEYENIDQFQIAWNLINWTQNQPKTGAALGITRHSSAASGVSRTRRYRPWQRLNIGDLLTDFAELDNGFDFEITPNRVWKNYYPEKGANNGAVFELGKNIGNISYDIDAGDTVTELSGMGGGTGSARCIAVVTHNPTLAEFGLLQDAQDFSKIKHYDTLEERTTEALRVRRGARLQPQLTIVTNDPPFGSYSVGDTARVKADLGYIDLNKNFRIVSQNVQVTDEGRESNQLYFDEVNA